MTELIQRWIQDRLGVLLDMSPEKFAEKARDGNLLAKILKSYEIITQDQLNTIEKTKSPEKATLNFQDHIFNWLRAMGIFIDNEELSQIVDGKGTSALNLFYQVYLELHPTGNLHFISQQRLKEKLRPENNRFLVQRLKERVPTSLGGIPVKKYAMPLAQEKDIIHWQKDKMHMLQAKCKEARQDYMQYIKSYQPSKPSIPRSDIQLRTKHEDELEKNLRAKSADLTYEELMGQSDKAKRMQKFVPKVQESKRILKKLRNKHKEHSENMVFKLELQRDIYTYFWEQVHDDEEDHLNKRVCDALLQQSTYEKQMHQKLEEIKLQKHIMLESKRNEAYEVSKQMETGFMHKLLAREKELDEKEVTYYLEKERLTELHTKLFEKKLRLKHDNDYETCRELVNSLVIMACNEADYVSKVGEDPPRRIRDTWKKMFSGGIPLESFVHRTEIILMKPEDRPRNTEEIVHLEIDRQEKIDEKDMQSYMAFEWPWSLDDIELDQNALEDMACALNILGNVIHNLLAAKYPYPPLPPKPKFPNISITACINSIDTQCVPVLQEILDLRDILVVDMKDCINFCVNSFIQETTTEMDDGDGSKVIKGGNNKGKGGKKNGEKDGKKNKKGTKPKATLLKKPDDVFVDDVFDMVEKGVQTPRYYPEEKIPLSKSAELGNVGRNILESGEQLTNQILMAMFVEYLKSKPNIKGWALVNYPKTFEEAAVLEECLTGHPVPKSNPHVLETSVSITELADLEENPSKIKKRDQLENLRMSRILPQPVVPSEPGFYDSSLTAYIKVIKRRALAAPKDSTTVSTTALKHGDRNRNEDGSSILDDLEDSADPLDRFYADLGCNYHFHYQKIDFTSIKCLAKLVLGDYSLPLKSSVELFGEAINNLNLDKDGFDGEMPTTVKKGEKKKKPKEKKIKTKTTEASTTSEKKQDKKSKTTLKSEKGRIKEKEKKNTKKDKSASKILIVHVDKYTQIPEEEEEEEELPELQESDMLDLPKPGEMGWEYINLPVSEKLQIAMATLWENAEEVYLVDLEQVFFLKRLIMNAVMPFVDSVKKHMGVYMNRPDEKQGILRDFQKTYNDFDDDLRNDEEFKAELHCRINQMREKLIEISDWKMIAADHERVFIINKNWTAKQLIQFTNNYIIGLQLELDRFSDSIVILCDYYCSIITKIPNDAVVIKDTISKLDLEDYAIVKAVNNLLQYVDESEETAITQFVEHVVGRCLNLVEMANNTARSSIRKMKELLELESRTKEKAKVPKTKEKRTGRVGRGMALDMDLDENIIKESSRIFDEWSCAVRGETMRVKVRLELLKRDLLRNMGEALGVIRRTFYNIYDEIRVRHEKELDSINAVCKLLGLAVERELSIQEELILDKSEFYIDPEVILFPDKLPPVRPLQETVKTGTFAVGQLIKIVEIFLDLSPSGYIPERSFSYLLQDLITSSDTPILVPSLWQKMLPRQADKISKHLFDDIEYIQWKDFIIYNLMLPFPTPEEILGLKKSFKAFDPDLTELITDYQYMKIKFWFEPKVKDPLKLKLIRQLLFKMYSVKDEKLNYTALLLDFCKDSNPLIGFAKALTVTVGNVVCWCKEIGERFVEMTERKKRKTAQMLKRKEQLEEGINVIQQILGEIIDNVFTTGPTDAKGKRMEKSDDIEPICNVSSHKDGSRSNSDSSAASVSVADASIKVEEVPDMAYYLPLDALITVITTCLPWHAKVQNIEDKSLKEIIEEIYEDCRNVDLENNVLCHEYLNHPLVIKELDRTCKFTAKNPLLIIEDLTGEVEEVSSRGKLKKHS